MCGRIAVSMMARCFAPRTAGSGRVPGRDVRGSRPESALADVLIQRIEPKTIQRNAIQLNFCP